MSKKQSRRTYPKAFREEAVALVTEQGYSVAKAAEAVGVTILFRSALPNFYETWIAKWFVAY